MQQAEQVQYTDLGKVVIDPMQTRERRLESFIEQVGDPYHLRVGKILVELCFDESQPTLEQKLSEYLSCSKLSL